MVGLMVRQPMPDVEHADGEKRHRESHPRVAYGPVPRHSRNHSMSGGDRQSRGGALVGAFGLRCRRHGRGVDATRTQARA